MMNELIIATKNQGKVNEFKTLFHPYHITVKSLLEIDQDIPDVAETGMTFEENARLKAETIAQVLHTTVLADDSGLAVDALDGKPGVYSARFAGEPKSDQRNNDKLLEVLSDEDHRTARFICVLACAIPGKETLFARGICEGQITRKPLGKDGFGYDPLFIPKGYDMTMAQLGNDEKNHISHRYHALNNLEYILQQEGIL